MDQLVSALSGLMALVSMATSTVQQGTMIKQQLSSSTQQQVVQQCPTGTQMMQAMQNGQPVMICIPETSQR